MYYAGFQPSIFLLKFLVLHNIYFNIPTYDAINITDLK